MELYSQEPLHSDYTILGFSAFGWIGFVSPGNILSTGPIQSLNTSFRTIYYSLKFRGSQPFFHVKMLSKHPIEVKNREKCVRLVFYFKSNKKVVISWHTRTPRNPGWDPLL